MADEQYTPTDEDMRKRHRYAWEQNPAFQRSAQEADEQWTRWLAAHDARVQAEAWDAAVASLRYADGSPVEVLSNGNPYRTTEEGSTP